MALYPKKSKSTVKKANQAVIRNILCVPHEDVWPRLPPTETEVLKAELKKHLVTLNVPRPKMPWKEIKKVGKEQRKRMVREFQETLPSEVLKAMELASVMRSSLFLGVNAVSCGIERDMVACCLLAEDVNPLSIVKHVVQLAKHAKVPVFLVSGFKQFCSEVMGFGCIAFGIAKPPISPSEPFAFIDACRLVREFYRNWERSFDNSVKNGSDDDDEEEAEDEEEAPPGKHHTTTQTATTTADAQESCDFLSSPSSFHLTRRSKYERAFTPRGGLQGEETICLKAYEDDDDGVHLSKVRTGISKYKLPTILRVRNNPFKLKKKKKKKRKKVQ